MIFVGGDLGTTTVAVAVAMSLAVSVACVVWGLLHSYLHPATKPPAGAAVRGGKGSRLDGAPPPPPPPSVAAATTGVVKRKPAARRGLAERMGWSGWPTCRSSQASWDTVYMVVEEACRTKPHEIDVSYMHLTCCPSRIGFIGVQLASLNMSNNRLPDIPEEIGCLRGLQELFLQYNCLTSLPKGIGRLEQLYELDLKNNMLRSLPDAIGDLRALAVLNVTNNALESLPASIGRLSALREVSAHSNCLESLPVEICELSNVTTLYLGENPLRALPERISALRRLQELDVSDCALTRLPDALAQCGSLIRLWLSNNRLRELPAQIGRLQQLKELHVRNNALRYFPASLRMLRLYTFTAVNNPLVEEGESDAIAALQRRPASRVPPLLESCCRGVVAHGVAWEAAGLPRDLHNMLRAPRQCCNCGGPFFTYCQSSLVFDSIGMFFRVPIYQNICSPFRKNKCRPMVFQ